MYEDKLYIRHKWIESQIIFRQSFSLFWGGRGQNPICRLFVEAIEQAFLTTVS